MSTQCIARPGAVWTTCRCPIHKAAHARTRKLRSAGLLPDPDRDQAWKLLNHWHGTLLWEPRAIASACGLKVDAMQATVKQEGRLLSRATVHAILNHGEPTEGRIGAAGSRRRLQALSVRGWGLNAMSAGSGLPKMTLSHVRAGGSPRVGVQIARSIASLYDDLAMTTGGSEAAIREATLKDWVPPFAWEEGEIDDPYAIPDMGAPVRGFDLDEWVYLVQTGEEPNRAAVRCGVQITAVERAAQRQGRRDVASLAAGARVREEKRAAA